MTKAVAAQQLEDFARQVHVSADASAEMGRRPRIRWQFQPLRASRQQVFYADRHHGAGDRTTRCHRCAVNN